MASPETRSSNGHTQQRRRVHLERTHALPELNNNPPGALGTMMSAGRTRNAAGDGKQPRWPRKRGKKKSLFILSLTVAGSSVRAARERSQRVAGRTARA